MISLAGSDLSMGKWAFDVSESVVSAVVGGLVVAVAAKRFGFSAFAAIPWGLILYPLATLASALAIVWGMAVLYGGDAVTSAGVLFTAVMVVGVTAVWFFGTRRNKPLEEAIRRQKHPVNQTGRGYRFPPLIPRS